MGVTPLLPAGRGVFARCGQGGMCGFPGRQGLRRHPVFRSKQFSGTFSLSGVTRDSAGVALAGCTVKLFSGRDDSLVAQTVSDGSGVYSFAVGLNYPVYIVAYKAGSPDVAGTSVNPLIPT